MLRRALALAALALPAAAWGAGFSQTGGGLGSINVNITVRPTMSPSGGSSSSGGSSYRERDWSPSERAHSQLAEVDLFEPIALALQAFADEVARATKPLRDFLAEVERNRKRDELARQMRAESIQRIVTVAAVARAYDLETLQHGLLALEQWHEEIAETDTGDCTANEHADLQDKVNRACKQPAYPGGRLRTACKKLPFHLLPRTPEDCAELQANLAQNLACAAARLKINQQCYDGGDDEHEEAWRNARRAAAICRAIIDADCKMFGVPAAKP